MRTLLEKAIVHLLNGDDEKAAALFHKFMVERARQIHESLRQDESEDMLEDNWDSEIKEEEYFDDDELADDGPAAADPPLDHAESPIDGEMASDAAGQHEEFAADDTDTDAIGDGDDQPLDGDSEPGLEGKIDDLTDKIDELTAEFDRVMAEFHDDDDDGDVVDDDDTADVDGLDLDADDDDHLPVAGADMSAHPDGGDSHELADRMADDMTDDDEHHHEPVPEGKLPAFLKDKKDKDLDEDSPTDDGDDDTLDESDDLHDITESVLAELDRIAPPGNAEHKGVGANTVKSNITAGNQESPLPHHNVMDRVKGEPVMTKGPTHKGYAKEEAPKVDGADNLVKNVRVGNRRRSYKDTMKTVASDGDGAALINKDFAPGMPKPTKSIIDGKTKKG